MTADDMAFMGEHGQPVHQMSVHQLYTMDKPGTLPISAYRTPMAVKPMEDEDGPLMLAEVAAAGVSSNEAEDNVTEEYDSESEESDSEEEAREQETEETGLCLAIINILGLAEPSDQS